MVVKWSGRTGRVLLTVRGCEDGVVGRGRVLLTVGGCEDGMVEAGIVFNFGHRVVAVKGADNDGGWDAETMWV